MGITNTQVEVHQTKISMHRKKIESQHTESGKHTQTTHTKEQHA